MRLALYQGPSPSGDLTAAFEAVEGALKGAAARSADMVLAPEVFLPGYNAEITGEPLDGDWVARLSDLCRETGVGLVIGLAEASGDATYNTAIALGADGRLLARYRKIQLYGARERAIYAPGDRLVTFDFAGRRLGLLICYDVEFPELTRALAQRGVDAILVPTANMEPFHYVSDLMIPARAVENAISVAYANYCGAEGDLTYVGRSLICGPDGATLAAAGSSPALLLADLPPHGDSEHLRDLRPIGDYIQDD